MSIKTNEKLVKSWNPDPNDKLAINIYETLGIKARLRGILGKKQPIEVPSAVAPHLFEPTIIKIKANQRIEITS